MKYLQVLCLSTALWAGHTAVAAASLTSTLECLALTVYHEARGEPLKGQIAVAYVPLNRQQHDKWPDTVCEVVSQAKLTKSAYVCQFTWYCFEDITPYDHKAWRQAIRVALMVYNGEVEDPTKGATCFHSVKKPRPNWAQKYPFLLRIAGHRYYDCTKQRNT